MLRNAGYTAARALPTHRNDPLPSADREVSHAIALECFEMLAQFDVLLRR
jgi:hypothetical protein